MNTYIYTEHDSCIQQMMQISVVTSRELQRIYLPVCHYILMYTGGMWTSLVDSFHISTNYNTNSYWRQYHDMTFWGLNAMINLSRSNNLESANFHRAGVGPLCPGEGLYDNWRHRARVTSHVSRVTLLSKPAHHITPYYRLLHLYIYVYRL